MEMHQLRYFAAVARTGSFSRAAEQCFVSQPSLSQQVAKLERTVGQALFDRLGRGARLTDAGRVLLDRALVILETVEDAERQLRDAEGLRGARLCLGAIPTIAPYLLPSLLAAFRESHPDVELTIQEDVTRNLVEAVAAGEVDLAVLAMPLADGRLELEPLWSEPLYLTLPAGHRLARKRSLTLDALRDERFIVLTEMHCLGEQVLSFCKAHACQPNIACRGAQIATVQTLVSLGQGVSLLPAMARDADASKQRVYRELSGAKPTRTIAAAWRRHRYHGRAAEAMLALLRGRRANRSAGPRTY
jgi:LysR family hydrogen peroxide-inducible transcriptional activator